MNSTRLGRHLHRVIGGLLRSGPRPAPAGSTTHHIPVRQDAAAAYPGDFAGTSTVL